MPRQKRRKNEIRRLSTDCDSVNPGIIVDESDGKMSRGEEGYSHFSEQNRSQTLDILCESAAPARQQYAAQLARQLSLPQVTKADSTLSLLLVVTEQRLELRYNSHSNPLYVDFLSKTIEHRRRTKSDKNQLLAKAVGIKKAYRPEVLDATAGLGTDGFILACLGCKVHWLERTPVIAALLQDGLTRYRQYRSDLDSQLKLTMIDAIVFLSASPPAPEVIYLDPMFPERNKSALGKQTMRILNQLAGTDEDAVLLLQLALRCATKRVVVKRPIWAPVIHAYKPDIVFTGKSCRFDVYQTNLG